jgi:hypothetical protein
VPKALILHNNRRLSMSQGFYERFLTVLSSYPWARTISSLSLSCRDTFEVTCHTHAMPRRGGEATHPECFASPDQPQLGLTFLRWLAGSPHTTSNTRGKRHGRSKTSDYRTASKEVTEAQRPALVFLGLRDAQLCAASMSALKVCCLS